MCKNWEKLCKIADLEKVRTGHERWTAHWPAIRVRAHACTLDNFGSGQSRMVWGRGP